MDKRPLSVTLTAYVYIAAGAIGIAWHSSDLLDGASFEDLWIHVVRLLAIVSGVFMLRGRNWARWLALVWIAFHVALSAFHTPLEFAIHAVFLAVIAWFLFRPDVAAYFRSTR